MILWILFWFCIGAALALGILALYRCLDGGVPRPVEWQPNKELSPLYKIDPPRPPEPKPEKCKMKCEYKVEIRENRGGKFYLVLICKQNGKILHRSQAHPDPRTPVDSYRNFVQYLREGGEVEGLDKEKEEEG